MRWPHVYHFGLEYVMKRTDPGQLISCSPLSAPPATCIRLLTKLLRRSNKIMQLNPLRTQDCTTIWLNTTAPLPTRSEMHPFTPNNSPKYRHHSLRDWVGKGHGGNIKEMRKRKRADEGSGKTDFIVHC